MPEIYLDVPFAENEEASRLGAQYDPTNKLWYVLSNADITLFKKWARVYLDVPYDDRVEAKSAGARWEPHTKRWYAPVNADMGKLSRWPVVRSNAKPASNPKTFKVGDKVIWSYDEGRSYEEPIEIAGVVEKLGGKTVQIRIARKFSGDCWRIMHHWVDPLRLTRRTAEVREIDNPKQMNVAA